MSTNSVKDRVRDSVTGQGDKDNEIVLHAYPNLVYVWPVIALGFLLLPFGQSEMAAWLYSSVLVVVIIALGLDLDRNVSIFWLVALGLGWILGLWLRDAKGIPILSNITQGFANIDPQYSPRMGLVISITLLIFFVLMFVKVWINDRWRITHNEIEHYSFGKRDDSLGRGAKRVVANYPDVFQLLILMSGNITIYSATGTRKLAVIENIPFLPLRMKKIDRILESTSITTEQMEAEEGEDEDDDAGLM